MGSVRVRAKERLFDGQQLREEGEEFLYHGPVPLRPNDPVELAEDRPKPKKQRRGRKHGEPAPEWTTEGSKHDATSAGDDDESDDE
jgi:hypothetical protein